METYLHQKDVFPHNCKEEGIAKACRAFYEMLTSDLVKDEKKGVDLISLRNHFNQQSEKAEKSKEYYDEHFNINIRSLKQEIARGAPNIP